MQHFINLTDDPRLGIKRIGEVRRFNWNILDDNIEVTIRVNYAKADGTIVQYPMPFDRTLIVDNTDYIDNTTGMVVLGEVYNSTFVIDEATGIRLNPTYPSVTPQYTFMLGVLSLGILKSEGITIDDNTKVSEILFNLIDQNINSSDQINHKFDQ